MNKNTSHKGIIQKFMKTKVLFTICCLAGTTMVMHAQDIITKTNGDEIKAKVTEVDLNEIKYKRFENLSGPTYTMPKSDIFMIKYENGEKDVFKKSSGESSSGVSGQRAAAQTQNAAPSASAYRSTTTSTAQSVSANVRSQPSQKTMVATTSEEDAPIKKYRLGIKGGLNSAFEYNSKGSSSSRLGIHLGVLFETALSSTVDIQPEIVYSMQGCGEYGGGYSDIVDYINLPIMVKIYLDPSHSYSIDIGPQFGYMVSAKLSYKGASVSIYNESALNKFDVSACIGASYKINQSFLISVRYNYGITKFVSESDNRNGVIQLGVGYMF